MIKVKENKNISVLYEIIMAMLAISAVSISFMDFTGHISITSNLPFYWIDLTILILFALDYLIRLIFSADRKKFFISNLFDLFAIIPFNSIFRAFRFVRLLRFTRFVRLIKMARILILLKKFTSRLDAFVKTNGFIYILYLTVITMLLGTVSIYYFELNQTIDSCADALWWSFVTVTTVGYGDISPITAQGRIVAAILMLVGIGFIGMLTGTIATFFINIKKTNHMHSQELTTVDLSDLSKEEYSEVLRFIEFVKSRR